jgi:hypothetical protein
MWIQLRERSPTALFRTFEVLLLLLLYAAASFVLERATQLDAATYVESSLALAFLQRLGWPLALLLAGGVFGLARFGHLLAPWQQLEAGNRLRAFVLIVASAAAWSLTTSGYNYYFDQAHAVDKWLLVALLPLAWWRPAFVLPLLALAYLLLWPLAEPSLGGSILPHKLQLLRALTLFATAFLLFAVNGDRRLPGFTLLLCCFVAAAYWVPAIAKLKFAWLGENPLYLIPLNAYAHGWLAFLPAGRIVDMAETMQALNGLLKAFVIVVESLCLVFLWRRRLGIGLLAAVIVFHVAVFAIYGFLFWTWIVLDVALLLLLLKLPPRSAALLFNRQSFVTSILLIATAAYWAKPPPLGWYDTPLTYTYRVEAYDDRGEGLHIHPRFFAPYDDVFTMASFSYLVADRAVLVEPYGVTNHREVLLALMRAGSARDIFALENASDLVRYDKERTARLEGFIRRFIAHRAARGEPSAWLDVVRAPQQFYSFRGDLPDAREIREIALVEVTSFYDGATLADIRSRELARFAVATAPPWQPVPPIKLH